MTAVLPPFSDFIDQLKSKAGCKQMVLLTHRPITSKVEPFAEPEHGFKALEGPPCCGEGLEAAHLRHVLLHPEMIAFNPLLQDFGHVMGWIFPKQAFVLGGLDGGGEFVCPISANAVRRQQGFVFQYLTEKPLGGIKVALGREKEIDGIAMFADGAVKIAPLATDFDIGLVDADRAAMRLAEETQARLDQGRISQDPSIKGAVIDFKAAFQEHFLDVSITQRIAQIPGDSLNDQPSLEMAALEVILRLAFQCLGNGIQDHGTLH
jgi:hypothetical protein